jgi:hypothetical protein
MTLDRCELVGGPYDGRLCSQRSNPFVWFVPTPDFVGLRGYADPGKGRVLYRKISEHVYLYAGHTHRRCDSCGAYVPLVADCGLCGNPALQT